MGRSKQPSSLGSSRVDGVPLFKTLREVIALVTDVMSAELGYLFFLLRCCLQMRSCFLSSHGLFVIISRFLSLAGKLELRCNLGMGEKKQNKTKTMCVLNCLCTASGGDLWIPAVICGLTCSCAVISVFPPISRRLSPGNIWFQKANPSQRRGFYNIGLLKLRNKQPHNTI